MREACSLKRFFNHLDTTSGPRDIVKKRVIFDPFTIFRTSLTYPKFQTNDCYEERSNTHFQEENIGHQAIRNHNTSLSNSRLVYSSISTISNEDELKTQFCLLFVSNL